MSNQVQESSHITTLRLSFPENFLDNVKNMKLIGKDLLFYVGEDDKESLSKSLQEMGLEVIDRVYKIHASAENETNFKNVLGDIAHEVRENSQSSRYIATISVDSKEEYDRILELNGDECFIKPYKARYSVFRKQSDDDYSDTRENIQASKKYQSSQQNGNQKKQYDNFKKSNTQTNGKSFHKQKYTKQTN